jgi:hypothetical protein
MSNDKRKNYNEFNYIVQKGIAEKLIYISTQNKDFKKSQTALFKYLYVVDKVTKHYKETYFIHHKSGNYEGCYINIETLKKILGADNGQTIRIIQDLIRHNIIKRVGQYLKGNNSYKYILGDITNNNFEEFTCNPKFERISYNIINKHNELYKLINDDLLLYKDYLSKIHIYGIESIYSSTLNIHPMLADFEIDGLIYGQIKEIKNLYINSLIVINKGEISLNRPDPISRVYTPLTYLKRELRRLLRYNGQGFIELDIRNSQPLIASILIKNYWQKHNKDIPEDVTRYIKDCENGVFYDYFMDLNGISEDSRGDFKVMFFACLFFSKVRKRLNELTKQFIEKYPSCYEAICSIKGGVGSDKFKFFSKSLQRQEAQIIFDDVNLGLLKRGIPAFNIFDSILCLPQDKEIVQEAILSAFSRHNLIPTLNTKDYTENVSIEAVMEEIEINRKIKLHKKSPKLKRRKYLNRNI